MATAREGDDLVHCDLSGADMARVMEIALYQAQLPKSRIDYINAHGVGLRDYDMAETVAIKTRLRRASLSYPCQFDQIDDRPAICGRRIAAGGGLLLDPAAWLSSPLLSIMTPPIPAVISIMSLTAPEPHACGLYWYTPTASEALTQPSCWAIWIRGWSNHGDGSCHWPSPVGDQLVPRRIGLLPATPPLVESHVCGLCGDDRRLVVLRQDGLRLCCEPSRAVLGAPGLRDRQPDRQ